MRFDDGGCVASLDDLVSADLLYSALRLADVSSLNGHFDSRPLVCVASWSFNTKQRSPSLSSVLSACACSPEVTVTSYSPTLFVSPRGLLNPNPRFSRGERQMEKDREKRRDGGKCLLH